jgi:dephospho-CoA kinase
MMSFIPEIEKLPLRVGITGGIGSGKTSVCKVFRVLGIPVFYADISAKIIMNNNDSLKKEINTVVGQNVYSNGSLNRSLLARLMYNDKKILEDINQLVHPLVFKDFTDWTQHQTSPYVIVEAAILFESGIYELVDKVITVIAPIEERIQRVMQRNKHTREQVIGIINNQMDDETKVKLSNFVVYNADEDMIIPVILDIHNDILSQIKKV